MSPIQGQLSLETEPDGATPAPRAADRRREDFAPPPSRRAAIEARARRRLLRGRGRHRQDHGARRPLLRRDRRGRGRGRADPRLHLHRARRRRAAHAGPPRAARRAVAAREARRRPLRADRLRTRASRETERAWVMTIHGFCRRAARHAPARRRDRPALSRARRGRGGAASPTGRATRRSIEARRRATRTSIERHRRLSARAAHGEMAVRAYERLRSQGMAEPRLPEVDEPVALDQGRARSSAR